MHFCLGAPLSKLEMRITLETLLDLAPDMALEPDQTIEYIPHLILDGMAALHIDLGPVPAGQPAGAAQRAEAPSGVAQQRHEPLCRE